MRAILQRLPGVLILLVLPYLLFAPYYAPTLFSIYYGFLLACFMLFSMRTAAGITFTLIQSRRNARIDWVQKRDQEVSTLRDAMGLKGEEAGTAAEELMTIRDILHVIVIPNYKESIETLKETLDVLASHAIAKTNYKICLGMEETEEGCQAKALSLATHYATSFHTITYTIHPKDLPNEIRGKSSNTNWACTQLFHRLTTTGTLLPRPDSMYPISLNDSCMDNLVLRHIFTCIDADTCFAADYFTTVAYEYSSISSHARKSVMFIPSIVFDRNSDKVNALVRMYDVSWSAASLSFFLPWYPFKPATSAYSIPMELARAVGFWDTDREALGEDFHMTIKCTFATSGRLRILPIFSPASQFNVCGTTPTFTSGLHARLVQLHRHSWGALNLGYTLRMCLLWFTNHHLPKSYFLGSHPSEPPGTHLRQTITILFTLYHTLEIFIWSTHTFVISLLVGLFIPNTAATPFFFAPVSKAWWSYLTGSAETPIPAIVLTTLQIGTYFVIGIMAPIVVTAVSYEMYYTWNSHTRWSSLPSASPTSTGAGSIHPVLGQRPETVSKPREWWRLIEWVLYPVSAAVTALAILNTCVWQMFTDRLDYKVAAKPVHEGKMVEE
ncbi:hypothetical protein HDU98_011150 [Podochytrium sp. JEL0797]|nr:hypothetical protein HDU98_011150 [Podochytrium sp. JEL0797]